MVRTRKWRSAMQQVVLLQLYFLEVGLCSDWLILALGRHTSFKSFALKLMGNARKW